MLFVDENQAHPTTRVPGPHMVFRDHLTFPGRRELIRAFKAQTTPRSIRPHGASPVVHSKQCSASVHSFSAISSHFVPKSRENLSDGDIVGRR
jgi:hypothetical protein